MEWDGMGESQHLCHHMSCLSLPPPPHTHTSPHLCERPAVSHAAHKRQGLLHAQGAGGALDDVHKVDVAVADLAHAPGAGGFGGADLGVVGGTSST